MRINQDERRYSAHHLQVSRRGPPSGAQRPRRRQAQLGVVMTMGALHQGHLSLVDACVNRCDVCVVTIFVNPTQFGPGEDYAKYPRELEADINALGHRRVDILFTPAAHEMYRAEHSTVVQPPAVANLLEGRHRPGHFAGVATIVLKLLRIRFRLIWLSSAKKIISNALSSKAWFKTSICPSRSFSAPPFGMTTDSH